VSRPAPLAVATLAQAAVELRLTARRGENLLAMVGIPAAVLLFFGSGDLLPAPAVGSRADALVPGTLALAILATGLVNLGIATAYERQYGVLKRLGGSPLGRVGLIGAKVLTIVAIEIVLVVLLMALAAIALGWRPGPAVSPAGFAAAFVLGSAAFAGLGLLLAGTLRAEATLALANALFVASLLLGGIILPVDHLPAPFAAVAGLLPAGALSEAFRASLGVGGDLARPIAVLAVWAAVAVLAAARTFRWE
jgi:ABC-2 type transport system permease protein